MYILIDEHGAASLAESWLRARGTAASGWLQQFEAMVGFARKHGWWDSERSAIRAHIESVGVV